jgi:hypothetical protein
MNFAFAGDADVGRAGFPGGVHFNSRSGERGFGLPGWKRRFEFGEGGESILVVWLSSSSMPGSSRSETGGNSTATTRWG